MLIGIAILVLILCAIRCRNCDERIREYDAQLRHLDLMDKLDQIDNSCKTQTRKKRKQRTISTCTRQLEDEYGRKITEKTVIDYR